MSPQSLRLLTLCLLSLALPAQAESPKLNVLFIAVDDLRPELGCYGTKHMQTPHIDRLAASGLLFERAYCQQAVCNPSRASVLSGCRPDTTRVMANNTFLRPNMPDVLTLPQHFKNHGYTSLSLGKVFHHSEKEPGDDPQSWSEPSWYHGPAYRHWFNQESLDHVKKLKALPTDKQPKQLRAAPFEAADEPDDSYPDAQTAAKAIETLQRLKTEEKPFFLGVGFVKPHLPFTCPQKYWDLYPADTIQLAANSARPKDAPEPAFHNWYELRTYGTVPPAGGITRDMALNLIRGYRACTSFMDAQVGRVLAELDRLGLRENTIVVLWGDHGYHLGEQAVWTKMTNFELGARVPLIVSAPKQITAGQRSRALVELVDLYPTLTQLCGLELPAHLEGTSFAPLLERPDQPWKTAAFSQFLRPGKDGVMGRSIRTDRWRYTEWTNAQKENLGAELYDEQNDAAENTNVAGDPKNAEVVAQLAKQLHAGWKAAQLAPAKTGSVPAPSNVPATASTSPGPRADLVLGAFDGGSLDGWTATGDAFPAKPFQPAATGRFTKFEGTGVAWSGRNGFPAQGALTSPEFEIQRGFLNFLAAGHRDFASRIGVELLIDDRVVRAAGASESKDESHALYWRTWEVREFAGRKARLRVNDHSVLGGLAVDSFAQSDEAKGLPVDATMLNHETLRPQFHYTTDAGWMNDANGLLYYKGTWHLFHQHRPPDHAAITWGHATSTDLVHWQRLPEAIKLEQTAASGSGVVDWKNLTGLQRGDEAPLLLFYTLHPGGKFTQCLMFSTDAGKTFEQYFGNPLLQTEDATDRDPKVFYHEPSKAWFMALSLSRNNQQRDQATYGIFRSPDLKSWKLLQQLGPGSWYWECPDLFELPIDGDPARTKWVFMKGSGDYLLGTLDDDGFKPETAQPIRTHWGGNFYGGQTFNDAPQGRRVHLAWISTGKDGPNSWPGMPFNQQMSFPRELTLRTTPEGPRLFREPVAEIAQLYTRTHELPARTLAPGENALDGISHELLDIDLQIDLQQAKQISLNLRGTEIVYDTKTQKLKVFDRAVSVAPMGGKLVLRILLDRTSIELFANRGEVTHSVAFFPAPAERRLSLTTQGGPTHVERLLVRELKSIWPANS